MTLTGALTAYLGTVPTLGLTWQGSGAYPADVVGLYVENLPEAPDIAVAVLSAGGGDSDSLLGWDEPRIEIRVSGDRDPATSWQIARRIYSHLHGLTDVTLPDGTYLGLAVCTGSGPAATAPDQHGRWQWTVSAQLDVAAPTEHRA